ncbi:hypothetical protein HK100_004449, partial [Physocladia obscura]
KILADNVTVEGSGITESGFVVVMVTKPKAAPVAPAASAASASATPAASVTPATPAPVVAASETPSVQAPVAESAPSATASATPIASVTATALPTAFDASTLATGTAYQAAVQNLIEMGFPAEQVARAMKAAYNNPDRAAEYLMTGIPENIESLAPVAPRAGAASAGTAPAAAATSAAPTPTDGGYVNLFEAGAAAAARPAAGAPGAAAAPGAAPTAADLERITALTNNPDFQQFRQLVQAQPQLLQPMLQQIAQSQPELLRLIQQHPDTFLQILTGGGGALGAEAFADDYEDDDEMAEGGGGPQTIQITPEENAAIERLTALGFDRNVAAQAYFACDKNEELAANYLFENGGDW